MGNFLEFLKALGDGNASANATIIMLTITAVNIFLTALKAGVTYMDGSMSIASSALESFGDVFSCFVIGYNRFKEQTAKPAKYPRGRNAQAQGYNICAYIMITVAFGSLLIELDRFVLQKIVPELNIFDVGVMGFNILVKGILWFVCYRSKQPELEVLQMDQSNDIVNNSVTIACLLLAIYVNIWFDLFGAFVICAFIVRNWLKVHSKYNKRVHGHVVKEDIYKGLSKHMDEISRVAAIEEIVAYHCGQPITVELFVNCTGSKFHESADAVREHCLKFENVQTVHVFPFDPRKGSADVEKNIVKVTPASDDPMTPLMINSTTMVDEISALDDSTGSSNEKEDASRVDGVSMD